MSGELSGETDMAIEPSPEAIAEKMKIFVIPGLFGAGISPDVLKGLQASLPDTEIISLNPGPVSSVHDRAAECFYQIKGGTVDYGLQHATENDHERYGRTYPGYFPAWDADHPIHLIGFSLGAPTARYLQHLLIKGELTDAQGERWATNGDWIRSLTTVQGSNNGSHCVHGVGLGRKSLQPKTLSILWFIFHFLYVSYWLLEDWFPLNADHWKCSRKSGKSLTEIWKSKPMINDNGGRDLSPKRMHDINQELSSTLPHPNTTYLACVATATFPLLPAIPRWHSPSRSLLTSFPENLFVVPLACFLGFLGGAMHRSYGLFQPVDYEQAEEEGEGSGDLRLLYHLQSNHAASDGVVSLAGQRHPYPEAASPRTLTLSALPVNKEMERGTWHHLEMPAGWNHIQTMKDGSKQRAFFSRLFSFLIGSNSSS